jgi:hypothetical protein
MQISGFSKPLVRVIESEKQVEDLEMLESTAGFLSLQTSDTMNADYMEPIEVIFPQF